MSNEAPPRGPGPGISNKTALIWIAGAAAVIVLVGGGYYAWNNFRPAAGPDAEIAATSTPFAAQLAQDEADAQIAAAAVTEPEPEVEPAAAPARAPAPRPRPVPMEATIGVPARVTTASTTADGATQPEETEEIVVPGARRPNWSRVPSARRLSAMYPTRALERGREGEASLHCIVQDGGALDCERVSETPGGFGAAALRVARTLRHAPSRADGSSAAGAAINLRILFRLEDDGRRWR